MKQEQVEQIVAATDNLIAQSISEAIAEQFNKRKKASINTNMIIGVVGVIILILALFAANSKLNNVVNSVEESNATTAVAISGAVTGLESTITAGDADIIAGIDNLQTDIGEIKDSVSKIPTKPVVIVQPNVKQYDKCVKFVMQSKFDAENTKAWMQICKGYLK